MAVLTVRNANESFVVSMVGLGGCLEPGGRFCVGAVGNTLTSVAVKMSSREFTLQRNFIYFLLSMRFATIMLQQLAFTGQHKKAHSRQV
jgi:hypothetical protein